VSPGPSAPGPASPRPASPGPAPPSPGSARRAPSVAPSSLAATSLAAALLAISSLAFALPATLPLAATLLAASLPAAPARRAAQPAPAQAAPASAPVLALVARALGLRVSGAPALPLDHPRAAPAGATVTGARPAPAARGTLRVTSTTTGPDGAPRPLPARVDVVAAGALRRAVGAVRPPTAVDGLDGDLSLQLAPGRYVVTVSHGPEWSLWRGEVDVRAGEAVAVAASLRREVDTGTWIAADLHVHTAASPDGKVDDAERAASLVREGIAFAAITDHNVVRALAADALPRAPLASAAAGDAFAAGGVTPGFVAAAGVEVTTWAPEIGHFNVFPIASAETRAPAHRRREAGELLAELRALAGEDGVVQIDHPRLQDHIAYFDLHGLDPRAGVDPADPRLAAHALEVYNGFDVARPDRVRAVLDEWLALRAAGARLVATGGSDAHDAERQLPGYPRTYVRVPLASPGAAEEGALARALGRALRGGAACVTSGPFLDVTVGGRGPGETHLLTVAERARGAVRVAVRMPRPDWLALTRLEVRRVTVAEGRGGRVDVALERRLEAGDGRAAPLMLDVPVDGPAELVVVVSGERPMPLLPRGDVLPLAFCNPIRIR
jgi:hypothetical protein